MNASEKYDKMSNIILRSYAEYSIVCEVKCFVLRRNKRNVARATLGITRMITKNRQIQRRKVRMCRMLSFVRARLENIILFSFMQWKIFPPTTSSVVIRGSTP
jgi:hypothetical protein